MISKIPLHEMRDIKANEAWPLPFLPGEIVCQIAAAIDEPKDLCNFRLVNQRYHAVSKYALGRRISNEITVYPRHAQMESLLESFGDEEVAKYVRNVTVLAEGLKEHEYGYQWAWEDLQIWADLKFTDDDLDTINKINISHADDVAMNSNFITAGRYRSTLTALFQCLPNLSTITVRKLEPGEHIPGWSGAELFKKLSFYNDRLDTAQIFYGDWQYDTTHLRVTQYMDEFCDLISEPDAGPQASFVDDLKAAMSTSGSEAKVCWAPGSRR